MVVEVLIGDLFIIAIASEIGIIILELISKNTGNISCTYSEEGK